jgi:hypothetical protein
LDKNGREKYSFFYKEKFTVVYMNKHENKKTLLLLAKLSRELRNVHFINIGVLYIILRVKMKIGAQL